MKILTKKYITKSGKINEYYCLRFQQNGKDIWRSLGKKGIITKALAEKIALKMLRDFELEKHGIKNIKCPKLKDFAKEYLDYQKNIRKIKSWERTETILVNLIKFFGNKKLNEITANKIDNYKKARLDSMIAPATVIRELAELRHLFYLAEKWERFFGKNPVAKAGLITINNQRDRVLNLEEEKNLLECSEPYLKAIIIGAINTALRKSEIINLKWSDVNLETNLITLQHSITKNNKTRMVPINATLRKVLLSQKLKSGGNDYVFLSSLNRPYKRHDSLNRAFKLALKKANIKDFRFHDLRHTSASRMADSGVSVIAISKILGHQNIQTTMRYSHPDSSLIEAVKSLDNYENKAKMV